MKTIRIAGVKLTPKITSAHLARVMFEIGLQGSSQLIFENKIIKSR